ncbi:MAG TPA: ChbG/HpnK family deacetylase, partial [Candidatus Eremiobacteraceae bacterium]|nr:ChbG/HpnK family deacetylase [Candidatus Eremiobacteraceae bacterium]
MSAFFRRLGWMVLMSTFAMSASGANAQQTSVPLQERLGYPANARVLIIHADDFGMMHSIDRAISQSLENGWVTSASV